MRVREFNFELSFLVVVWLLCAHSLIADTIHFRDGKLVSGRIVGSDNSSIFIDTDGKRLNIKKREIDYLEFSKDGRLLRKKSKKKKEKAELPSDVSKIIDEFRRLREYPEAGAIILEDEKKVTLNSDGSSVMEIHFLAKILKDRCKSYSFCSTRKPPIPGHSFRRIRYEP